MNISRRNFIKYTSMGLIGAAFSYNGKAFSSAFEADEDRLIFLEKIKFAEDNNLRQRPINEIIIEIGKSFIGTPYVGDTLDLSGNEELITNLRGLDCWTFFENSLVIGRIIKEGKNTFEDYKKELEFIRYRQGIRKGYASRLHYIIDWIYDNVQKGVVKDINKELGGIKLNKTINFMTSHREYYPPLSDEDTYNKIKKAEEDINSRTYYYIPTELLPDIEKNLKTGDIFGFITDIEGLDASHTGFIYKENDCLYILDEASSAGYADISEETLYEYLSRKDIPGIIVARPA